MRQFVRRFLPALACSLFSIAAPAQQDFSRVEIKAAIARITDKPVQFVLNTHFHFDHAGGSETFGNDGAVIVADENARLRVSSEQVMAAIGARQPASPEVPLPLNTTSSERRFQIKGDDVHAFHAPRGIGVSCRPHQRPGEA